MSTTQPQIVPAMPYPAENSTPAEAPRSISLERPSPADSDSTLSGERQALHVESDHGAGNAVPIGVTSRRDWKDDRGEELAPSWSHKPAEDGAIPSPAPIDSIPDQSLTTKPAMRARMRELIARVVVLSERIAAIGITQAELDAEDANHA